MQEKITVTPANATDQYIVENNFSDLGGPFFERYVCFSGYFGNHGPHVFAAGPGLYEALELAIEYWEHRQMRYKNRAPVWVQKARAALKLARGEV